MIDWSREIEAVNPDGRVFKTTLIRTYDEGRMVRWLVGESPWSGMFTENGVAVLGGGWTIQNTTPKPMEFGPEIKVDGKRPEWLDGYDGPVRWWNEDQRQGITCPDSSTLNWGPYLGHKHGAVTSFALPANHSHYATPTPDERAVAPELVERMRKLAVDIVARDNENRNSGMFAEYESGPLFDEARAIVAALEPVDEDLVIARQMAAEEACKHHDHYVIVPTKDGVGQRVWGASAAAMILDGQADDSPAVSGRLAAIKRGRELATSA